MPLPLSSPKNQPAWTHVRLNSVEFDLENNAVYVQAVVGPLEGSVVEPRERVEFAWDQAAVNANLTQAERDALLSIRDKIMAAIEARL